MLFFINGILVTLLTWALQYFIFIQFADRDSWGYALSTAIAFIVVLIINFLIQRSLIFKQQGLFRKYLLTDLFILLLVTILAPVCRLLLSAVITPEIGDKGGFLMAGLIASVPSFIIKKMWVFDGLGKAYARD